MIDWQRITELETELGADEVPALVAVFLEEVGAAMDSLTAPTEADLHFIRGSAATLGFTDLTRLAGEGEASLKANPAASIDCARLLSAFDAERRELMNRFPEAA